MEGIERIKKMAEGQKDFVLLAVVEYLISRIDMNEKYLKEEKTLKGMALYIQGQILEEFCKKMNTKNPASFAQEVTYNGKNARCLATGMSEERTYELAINYFNKSNEELGIKPEEKKVEKVVNKNENKKDEDDGFGSIFEAAKIKQKKKEEIEQISLFAVV